MGLVYLVFGELANDFLTKEHWWPVLSTGNKMNYTIDYHRPMVVTENSCCAAVSTVTVAALITVADTDYTVVMITIVGADCILFTVMDGTVNTVYIDALS